VLSPLTREYWVECGRKDIQVWGFNIQRLQLRDSAHRGFSPLMAFDDQWAAAALSALRSLSEKTQVLIFTHHAHHVKLAEEVLGSGFGLHELSAGLNVSA
jgi:hypothetical protein